MNPSTTRLLATMSILSILSPVGGPVLSAAQGKVATDAGSCTASLWEAPAVKMEATQAWESDTANQVGYRSTATDKLESQYVAGDILRLSRDEFPSESRTIAESQGGVRSITFDAREIVIDMPLVFTSASVRFLAESVRFTQRGSITFTDVPRDGGDGVSIIAASIDASQALHHPLQFVTQDTAWEAGTKRTVSVIASTIKGVSPVSSPEKWAEGLTLDQDYADLPKGSSISKAYAIVTGVPARAMYSKSLSTEMLWPQQFADKVARQFAEAPFDEDRSAFLKKKIEAYSTILRNTNNELALAELASVRTAIDLRVDQLGFHRYFVPRTSFAEFQKAFAKLAAEDLTSMKDWDYAILAAHSGRQFNQAQFDDLSKRFKMAGDDVAAASDQVSKQLGVLGSQEQQVTTVLQKIDQEEEGIKAKRADDAEKAQTNGVIDTSTKVLVMAASFIPVSAPVAIGIGVAVNMAGKAVLTHNQGGTVTGATVVLSLPQAIEESKSFNTSVRAVQQDWNNLTASAKALKDKQDQLAKTTAADAKGKATVARNDAAEKAASDVGKFGGDISALFNKVQSPAPTQLSLDDYEKKDTALQALIKQVGEIRNAEAETLANLDAARRDVVLKTNRREELRTDVETARTTSLQNDREVSRLEELAWTVRQSFLRDLAFNVAVLLRAYKYHTSLDPEGPINATYFSTYYRLSRPSESSNSGRQGEQFFYGGSDEDLKQALTKEDEQLKTEVDTLETQVDQGYEKYFGLMSQHNFLSENKELSCSNDDSQSGDRCIFLRAVNSEIARQIASVAAGNTETRPVAIPIPVSFQDAFTGMPEKLLDASVAIDVEDVTRFQGNSIQFSVVHPFVGSLVVGSKCYTVDMRRADAIENMQRYTSSCDSSGKCSHSPVMLKEEYINENKTLTALPLNGQYYFEVRVRDAVNPSTVPVLTKIEIGFSYVQ